MSNLDKLRDKYDTSSLLDAIDALDTIRSIVASGPDLEPPKLRQDLFNLHTAMDKIINEDADVPQDDDANPFYLADDIDSQVSEIGEAAETIPSALSDLVYFCPDEDEEYNDTEDEDDEDS
jgi:hypothetical protein